MGTCSFSVSSSVVWGVMRFYYRYLPTGVLATDDTCSFSVSSSVVWGVMRFYYRYLPTGVLATDDTCSFSVSSSVVWGVMRFYYRYLPTGILATDKTCSFSVSSSVVWGVMRLYSGMRTVSNSQSGKSVVCSPNGAKEILKPLIKGLNSQNTNRNHSVFFHFIYQILNLTMFKLNLSKIQQTINDSPASAQSGIPGQS